MNLTLLIIILMFLNRNIGFLSLALFLALNGYIGIIPLLILIFIYYSGILSTLVQSGGNHESTSAIQTLELIKRHHNLNKENPTQIVTS